MSLIPRIKRDISRALNEAHGSRRSNREEGVSQRVPLVIEYHPGLPNLKGILQGHQPLLHVSPIMMEIVPDLPMLSFSQPLNLKKKMFVRASVKNRISKLGSSKHCTKSCRLCKDLVNCSVVRSHSTGKAFKVKTRDVDCFATWVVYCIFCPQCGIQYVGMSCNLKERMDNHRSALQRVVREGVGCRIGFLKVLLSVVYSPSFSLS